MLRRVRSSSAEGHVFVLFSFEITCKSWNPWRAGKLFLITLWLLDHFGDIVFGICYLNQKHGGPQCESWNGLYYLTLLIYNPSYSEMFVYILQFKSTVCLQAKAKQKKKCQPVEIISCTSWLCSGKSSLLSSLQLVIFNFF